MRMHPATTTEIPPPRSVERLTRWMSTELACIAGRRELAKGRYAIADLAVADVKAVVDRFREEVRQLRKVALICLIPRTPANMSPCTPVIDVLRELSAVGASLSRLGADALLRGAMLEMPLLLDCPVTGAPTTYSFFGVAFCPQAANAADALHDLPLAAPYPLINITSDAFAFAMFVRDVSLQRHGLAPYLITSRRERMMLFADCVARWQRFSLHTLSTFAERTRGSACPVRVSDDGLSWQAVHNDPAFAETTKEVHVHEMPSIYGAGLAAQWNAVLDRQSLHFHARSGQSGGRRVDALRQCPVTGHYRSFGGAAAAH